MSENAVISSPEKRARLECPGISLDPDRNGDSFKNPSIHILRQLTDLGHKYCMARCSKHTVCEPDGWPPKPLHDPSAENEYRRLFYEAHNAFGFMPDEDLRIIAECSNGMCPVCTILMSLSRFGVIARYADNKPLGTDSLPCWLVLDKTATGLDYWKHVGPIDALAHIDLDNLPEKMTPAEDLRVRNILAPGRAILLFLQGYRDASSKSPLMISDGELWAILACDGFVHDTKKPISSSWVHYAKKCILNSENQTATEYLCKIACIAMDCRRHLEYEMRFEPGVTEFDRMRGILIAARYYYDDISLTNDGFETFLQKNLSGYFSREFGDFGVVYCTPSALAKAVGQKHYGSPPPFFSTYTTPEFIKQGNINKNKSSSISTGGEGGKGGDANINNAPVNAPVAKMEVAEGTFQNKNTVNVAGQGDVVRETRETVFKTLDWVEERIGVPLGIPKGSSGKSDDSQTDGDAREPKNKRTMLTHEQLAAIAGEKAGLKINPASETMRTLMKKNNVPVEKARINGRETNTYDKELAMPHIDQWVAENGPPPF